MVVNDNNPAERDKEFLNMCKALKEAEKIIDLQNKLLELEKQTLKTYTVYLPHMKQLNKTLDKIEDILIKEGSIDLLQYHEVMYGDIK